MANFKNQRLSEDIMRELAGLIRERIKDPRVNVMAISVVRVELSGDNSHCKVFISSFNGIEDAKNAVRSLAGASGMLRREITNKLHIRRCPELHFIPDDSIEHSAEISKMLKSVLPDSDSQEDLETEEN
ncbi:MAG: 30S ribosome-binding factor RbfA [Oscillospiraceae bacterium]|nr:30S ribosome-binding factor RbfA [Oscillospiraceae bacterium]